MIKAIYYRKINRLVMEGHAGAGAVGEDLVCAAASMIAYTLAANVDRLVECGQAREPVISIKEGDTVITCNAVRRYRDVVTLVFDSVLMGLGLLAAKHPQNISFEIRQG